MPARPPLCSRRNLRQVSRQERGAIEVLDLDIAELPRLSREVGRDEEAAERLSGRCDIRSQFLMMGLHPLVLD